MDNKKLRKAYWIQNTVKKMKKRGTVGALREMLGVSQDKIIPTETLKKAAKAKGKLGLRARWALNIRKRRTK